MLVSCKGFCIGCMRAYGNRNAQPILNPKPLTPSTADNEADDCKMWEAFCPTLLRVLNFQNPKL